MTDSGLLTGLTHLVEGRTRSISPENFHGEKGKGGMATEGTGKNCARELGQGWKISPSVDIPEKGKLTLAEIEGSGIIQHIWLTCPHEDWRSFILRMYWDGEEVPSIEVPLGDFFCMGWCEPGLMQSIPICVNPKGGMNSYWQMPFRKSAKITLENLTDKKSVIYYQITYSETAVAEDTPYFHAQFHRDNPLEYKKNYVILDKATEKDSMSEPTSHGASTATAGGERARLNFSWTEIRSSRRSAEPEQKTTSAARGILNIRRENIVGFRRRIPDCIRF